jgi:hypothetical protein
MEEPDEQQSAPIKKRVTNRAKVDDSLLLDDKKGLRRLYETMQTFKPTGDEIEDLRRLLQVYSEWHFCLAPHFSFDYVLQKLQKLGPKPPIRSFMSRLRNVHKGKLTWEEIQQRDEVMGVEEEEFVELKRRVEEEEEQASEKRVRLDEEAMI